MMHRYTATRIILRLSVLALSIGPAHGKVQVGELIVTPGLDSVTVRSAQQAQSPQPQSPQAMQAAGEPGVVPVRPDPGPALHVFVHDEDLPPPRPRSRPLPPMPAPRSHDMQRDMLTLKAARAAMELDDQLHAPKVAAMR